MGIIGRPDTIKVVITALGRSFKVKTMGEMKNYYAYKIIYTIDKDDVWKHQPNLLKNLKESFIGDTARIFETPSAPKTLIICPKEGYPLISPEKQKTFRMGVGMQLYLVKQSRPNISNSVRELSKVADRATEGHFKALLRTVKYAMDTENKGISDIKYALDPDTRISVYGYVL
jgi:hypothetical protein